MVSEHQKPIESGFQAKSEPSDILAGIDLAGKTAIVTGGYSGIGFETVRAKPWWIFCPLRRSAKWIYRM